MPKILAPAAAALADVGNLPAEPPATTDPVPKKPRKRVEKVPAAAKEIASELAVAPELKGKRMPKAKPDVVKPAGKASEKAKVMAEKMVSKKSKAAAAPKTVSYDKKAMAVVRRKFRDEYHEGRKAVEEEMERLRENMENVKKSRAALKELRANLREAKMIHKNELEEHMSEKKNPN